MPLVKVKVESEKVGLKLNIQKTKIIASGPTTSWEIDGETLETVSDFIFWPPKSLQMVTAAMKLKGAWKKSYDQPSSVQFSSVTQSCPTLGNPMNCSTPGLPVHHQFPEFTQTPVHRVGDTIQPSHPLSPLSPPTPNPSQHQSLFQ